MCGTICKEGAVFAPFHNDGRIMDSSQHTGDEAADFLYRIGAEESQSGFISQQSHSGRFLE